MKTAKSRVLIVAILVIGTLAFSTLAMSMNASAAGVSGTWVSRTYGEGYILDNVPVGPYTWHYDVHMELSQSGSAVSGTATFTLITVDVNNPSYDPWTEGIGAPFSYTVTGYTSGSTFSIQVYSVGDIQTGDLTCTSDSMYGNSYYSIDAYNNFAAVWDLKKEGLFGIGGIAPMVSALAIVASVVAIVVAVTPPKASAAPKGFQPQMTKIPSPPPRYEPSQQWTTEMPPQLMSGDGTVPIGGVGLTDGIVVRPMTETESHVVKAVSKSPRNNAVGIAVVSIVMAVMINFIEDDVAMIMPLFFCFVGLGLAVQARKSSGAVGRALAAGTVTDIRTTPKWARTGNCDLGGFSVPRSSQMKKMLVDGVPVSVTIIPEAKQLLSVNGVPLKKPVAIVAPAGFENTLASRAAAQAPRQAPAAVDQQDIPPPPDGWAARKCPRCGKNLADEAVFCDSCGFKLKSSP